MTVLCKPSALATLVAAVCLALAPSIARAAEPLVHAGESVAFLGDSITAQGAASAGGYVRLVESGLAANGIAITVFPAGISGHKSNQMRDRLQADVLAKKPTWMTLSCGVNDVWHGANGVALPDYKVNITDIVDRCQKAGVKVMILTSTQIKLPLDNPENTKLVAYNAFLRDLAAERKLPLADLNADMAAEQAAQAKGGKHVLTNDGVHMNIYGNLMMARGVLRAFGLDAAQMAAAEAKWRTLPDAVPFSTKLAISLPEMEVLEALAAQRKQPVEAIVGEAASQALKALLAGQAAAAKP